VSVEAVQEKIDLRGRGFRWLSGFVGAVGDVVSGEAEVLVVEITERVAEIAGGVSGAHAVGIGVEAVRPCR